MEKQKHIYSDLHEFSPLFTRAQPLSLFQIKWRFDGSLKYFLISGFLDYT